MTAAEPVSSIGPVLQTSIRATITRALRNAIISGEFRPGEIHTGPGLAAQFGVSATPVREAMLDLAKEGLVTVLRNKGFQITNVSNEDLADLAQIRVLIEPVIAARVTPLIPADGVERLRVMAQRIVERAAEGNLADFIEADREFHLAIMEYAGNARLTKLVSDLRLQTRLLGLKPLLERGELAENAREH
ncbi:GntR family transcriptional regulator, partial [bacterium]